MVYSLKWMSYLGRNDLSVAATDSSKPWDKVEREMFLSKNHFRSGLGHRVTITKAIFA